MSLSRVLKRFPSKLDCIRLIETLRWGDSPVCPYCGAVGSSSLPQEGRHHCKLCNTTYSVLVGTIFHNSKLDLRKWFGAASIILINPKRPYARKLAAELKISKNTAWSMITRVSMATPSERAMLLEIGERCGTR